VDNPPSQQRTWPLFDGRPSNRRLVAIIVLVVVLLAFLWLGVKAWRIGRVVRALPAYDQAFAALSEEGLANADPEEMEALVMALRSDVVTVRREVQPLLPLTSLFSWLPRVGPVLAEARPLLELADSGTEAAAYAVRALKPALVVVQEPEPGNSTIARLVPILAAARTDLERAAGALDRATAARAEIERPDALPWRVRTLLEQLDEKLYLADIFDLLLVAPELLGHDEPRTYLLVAQNEDEIRATGGFISGAGLLIVDNGEIRDLQFQDANLVDAWDGSGLAKPYDMAPEPLWQLMGVQLWLFRDANFWPDFPTSAEKMMELYSYGQSLPEPDGVIAMDQQFLALLLQNTGPLVVEELEMTVSAQNVVEALQQAWQTPEEGQSGSEWIVTRKDFLGPMATAIKEKLLSDIGSLDLLFLAENIYRALAEKHLQIYVTDPEVAAVLAENGWSNRVAAAPGHDLLLLIDSNVGYNKVAPYIDSSLSYEVLLDASGQGEAVVTAVYTHTLQEEIECRQGGQVSYSSIPDYAELAEDCFWNYLRLYVPAGSELQQATRHPYDASAFRLSEGWSAGPQAPSEFEGVALFHNFFLLPPRNTVKSVYRYVLPQVVRPDEGRQVYELWMIRQAGAAPRPYSVDITLPPGARLWEAHPDPAYQAGSRVHFRGELNRDLTIRVVYDGP
jgi:hypothetical protein